MQGPPPALKLVLSTQMFLHSSLLLSMYLCAWIFFSFTHRFFLPSPCSPWLFHFPDPFSFKTSFLVRLALTLFSRCLRCCPMQNQNRDRLCLIKDLFTLSILSHELLSHAWPGLFFQLFRVSSWTHFNQTFVSTTPWKLFFPASSTTSTSPHLEVISISYLLLLSGEGTVSHSLSQDTSRGLQKAVFLFPFCFTSVLSSSAELNLSSAIDSFKVET